MVILGAYAGDIVRHTLWDILRGCGWREDVKSRKLLVLFPIPRVVVLASSERPWSRVQYLCLMGKWKKIVDSKYKFCLTLAFDFGLRLIDWILEETLRSYPSTCASTRSQASSSWSTCHCTASSLRFFCSKLDPDIFDQLIHSFHTSTSTSYWRSWILIGRLLGFHFHLVVNCHSCQDFDSISRLCYHKRSHTHNEKGTPHNLLWFSFTIPPFVSDFILFVHPLRSGWVSSSSSSVVPIFFV